MTAFIYVSKAMLDLGPVWIDRYVRALLVEANAAGLEDAIVDGDGKDKPLGMTRALTGATDGVYPRKSAITLTALDQVAFGTILNTLSQGPNSKRRAVTNIMLVVNPTDYLHEGFPATTKAPRMAVQPRCVPVPRPRSNFSVGSGSVGVCDLLDLADDISQVSVRRKVARSSTLTNTALIEDERVCQKLYGDGRPLDANASVLADIPA